MGQGEDHVKMRRVQKPLLLRLDPFEPFALRAEVTAAMSTGMKVPDAFVLFVASVVTFTHGFGPAINNAGDCLAVLLRLRRLV